jgi:hypothetical protein
MSPGRNLLIAIAGMLVLTAGGSVGYMAIEHMSALDALRRGSSLARPARKSEGGPTD